MAFFDSFTDSIKQKWLQFFQLNREWISMHMAVESVYTPDGGKRPPSYLILGVVNALEPKLAQLMYPFSKLNPDADTLVEVLDLHFDPDIALGNRISPMTEPRSYANHSGLETTSDSEDGESLTDNGFDHLAVGNGHSDDSEAMGNFEDMSFESMTLADDNLDDQGLEDLTPPEETAFSDVLSDVWGDEMSLAKGDDNNESFGEELPSGVFDESEMARLFPNA
ncbi:hypothetical protein B6N60_02170 [Richelia sinica FACHB-800]|uniref:DUF5331 domain-containing protein n=1 Tax=Richelia sinica FACHB-800 TaxID=1357546 RepID=A0A975T7S3_9NOST|nr:DUF5331 domain-containing protein [Richelia sinica]MBD2667443.1 hypothetical protein [Richelia sinica FACHB-800]QXE23480.1 hypothetical protein B6N60_02170 [Richelia sinica FACHB-800]